MKRFLSIILALCMIMALVPSAFAEDTTTEEYSGITVVYGIYEGAGYSFEGSTDVKGITFNNTNGFWSWHSRGGGNTSRACTINKSYGMYLVAGEGNWGAIEIYVPKAGKYDISLEHGVAKTSGALEAGMWILPLTNSATGKEYTDAEITNALADETTAITTKICFNNKDQKSNVTKTTSSVGSHYFPNEGKYIVVYKTLSPGYNGEGEALSYHMYPGKITLNGNSENAILMAMGTSVDSTELTVGATSQMNATAYMSNQTEADCAITYTSSDENIAAVDENGLITAKSYGTATVTASAAIGDYKVNGTESVSVSAEGVSIMYDVGTLSAAVTSEDPYAYLKAPTYETTNGFYKFYDTNVDTSTAGDVIRPRTKNLQLSNNRAAVYEVYIPAAGTYQMQMYNGVLSTAKSINVYLSTVAEIEKNGGVYKSDNSGKKANIIASLGTYVGSYDCSKDGTATVAGTFSKIVSKPNIVSGFVIPEPGYYTIGFYADGGNGSVGDFILANGTGLIVPMSAPLTISDDTASVAETVVMSDGNEAALDDTYTVTYTSSNKSVATVDAATGAITKLANGTTEITAAVAKNGGMAMSTVKYEVTDMTPALETVSANVAFSAVTNVDGYSVEVTGIDYNNAVASIERGKSVTVTAPEIPNYKFVGWKRGSGDNGSYINKPASFTFKLVTNTFLTAMYDEIDESEATEPTVEYYNENGDYITTQSATLAAPDAPSLVGYSFTDGEWYVADGKKLELTALTAAVTRAVAKHTANRLDAAVTVNGSSVSDVVFNKEVTAEDSSATCWKRDGKVVAYGTEYTHYIWGATAITSSDEEITEKAPLVILESGNDAYMIEYDAGDKTIVEAGILFGSGTPTVNSCTKKYTSQRNVSHGQFTASYEGTARGYIIYEDSDGSYCIKYSD